MSFKKRKRKRHVVNVNIEEEDSVEKRSEA
jgi:hypothetical protein